jgi:hypothetical protein
MAWQVNAQVQAPISQSELQALNARVTQAYQAGDYIKLQMETITMYGLLKWLRGAGYALLGTVAIMLTCPATGQSTGADAVNQWQSLNEQAMEAYGGGDYRRGVVLAKQALQLAQQTFGSQDFRTITSEASPQTDKACILEIT